MTENARSGFEKVALERMKHSGLRMTKPRKLVVKTLANTEQPLSAYRIHEQISANGGQIDVVSVYRTLSSLDSLGLVHYVHSADGFMPCTMHSHDEAGVEHAVCDDCGSVVELNLSKETAEEITGQLDQIGFKLRHVRVEIEGQCGNCKTQSASGA